VIFFGGAFVTKLAKTAIAATIVTLLGGLGSVARGGVGPTVVDPLATPDVVDQFEGLLTPPGLTDTHGAGDQWGSSLLLDGALDFGSPAPPLSIKPGTVPKAPAMAMMAPPPSHTPEPTSLSLLAVGAAALLTRRKR